MVAVAAKARDRQLRSRRRPATSDIVTTILATIELGLRFGHVAHLAPLARGLARRGVKTALATRDVITASAVSDRPFAAILQAPVYPRAVPQVPTLTYAQVVADAGLADVDHATALVAAWLQLFDGVRPDAVASEFAPVSLLAAHVAGLKCVRTSSAWAVPPGVRPLPSLTPWLPDDPGARADAGATADAVVAEVCRRFAAPPLDGLSELLAATPRFLHTWPEMDHHGARAGEVYYGPMTGLGSAVRVAWPRAPGPRVFVYLPADHHGAAPLAAALARLGWPAVWYAGGAYPTGLAANVTVPGQPLDLDHMLAEAAILVGRGGHATGCEALRHGCAQLIMPDTLETTLVGWRLARLGLGTILDAPTTDAVEAALIALTEDSRVAAATAGAQARYATYDPVRAEDQLARDVCAALSL